MSEQRSNTGDPLRGVPISNTGEEIPAVPQADPRAQAAFDARWAAGRLIERQMQEEAIAREQQQRMAQHQPPLQSLLSGMADLPHHLRQGLQQGVVEGSRAMAAAGNQGPQQSDAYEQWKERKRQEAEKFAQLEERYLLLKADAKRREAMERAAGVPYAMDKQAQREQEGRK